MGKYLKKFDNHAQYDAFIGGGVEAVEQYGEFILPNVSHCVEENEVHYNPLSLLTVTYNVTDASNPTRIYLYNTEEPSSDDFPPITRGVDYFYKAEVDGTEVSIADLDSDSGKYNFSTGEHTVKFFLKDASRISRFLFGGIQNITGVIIPNGVVSIDEYAFAYCQNLSNISIPKTLVNIEENAFINCESLTVVDKIIYADDCAVGTSDKTLSTYTLREGTRLIGPDAFDGCTNLTDITIPSSVEYIMDGAFCGCEYILNSEDKTLINSINPNAFCELLCIQATFADDVDKALLGAGTAFGYEIDGNMIPWNEIIEETNS